MSWIRYDIFLSYSHRDAASIDLFVEAMRDRGYSVFYDKKSIVVGDAWKRTLAEAIRASRVCILCWSAEARSSEYVSFEYSSAEGLRKPVLPWLLDSTRAPTDGRNTRCGRARSCKSSFSFPASAWLAALPETPGSGDMPATDSCGFGPWILEGESTAATLGIQRPGRRQRNQASDPGCQGRSGSK